MPTTHEEKQISPEHESVVMDSHWSRSGGYSEDDLIGAYEMGKEKGREESHNEPVRVFREYIRRALHEAERFYLDLRSEHDITPIQAFVRVCSVWPFIAEALYLIPHDQFISDLILDGYRSASERAQKLRNDGDDEVQFDLSFRFMPVTEDTDTAAINSDFEFRYERKHTP